MKSRVFGTLASIMMIISLLTYFPAVGASAEETLVNDSKSSVSVNNDDYSVSGTTSFGKMFSDSIDEKSQEQEDNDGYNVFAAEYSEQNSFYVSFETKENCTLLVGIYDEAGEKMLASGRQAVTFDETEKIVEIDTGVIPDYYYLKVFLVDDNSLRPLCKAYQSPNYTREMQEFFQKDTDDFEDDKVLNFDSDKDNNFAVYSDDTIIIDRKDGVNDVVLSDLENEKYTIENIDSSISSLKEGDIFAYQYSDDDALIVKIKSIDIDGTTANITGDDVDMENVFEYVKIDAEQGATDAEVDTSGCDDSTVYKGVEIEDQNESTPDTENGIQPQLLAADADASLKGTFVYEFLGAKNNEDDPDSHLKGSLKMGVSANIKLYISAKYQYLELKLSADVTINVSIEDKASLSIPLGEARYIPVTGVTIKYKMAFVVEVNASLKYEVKYTLASVGFSVSSDVGFKNLTKKPTTEYTPELSTSISAFIGMQYTLKASFISEKIVDASLTTRIGFTINASAVIATTNDSVIHDCILCFDGDMTPEISFVAKCKLFNSNKLSWEAQLFDLKLKVLNFYYCNDLHKFGWGECPRKKYKVTYTVYDENKDPVKDAVIDTGVKNIQPLTTDDSGTATAYLKAGTYTATLENYKDSKEKEYVINEKRTSVRLSTKGADLSDTIDDYENCDNDFEIYRYDDDTCKITGYKGSKTKLKIPKEIYGYPVASIYSLGVNETIKEVIIPNYIHSIDSYAFNNCSSLQKITVANDNKYYTSVDGILFSKNKDTIIRFPIGRSETEYVIPDYVVEIGDRAFENCSNLSNLTIPNGVTTIGNAAFECTLISAIDIPESVTEIGGSSFRQCVKLEEIDIPKNVEYIESYTFYYCKALQKVTIKGNITGIGYYAFSICSSLKEINIPNSLKEIGDYAFECCSNLENIELPDGLEEIGDVSFWGCEKLTQINIPSSVKEIGESAFAYCSNLSSVNLSTGITSISEGAFKDCRSLSSITIPDTVNFLGKSCFENCTSLTAVSLPNQITLIFERSFYNCSSLVNIDLPDTVQDIMREAFASCTALVSIELPNNITELGSMAFSDCSNLENVNIPNKITYINYGLFEDCKNLNHIIIPENVEQIDDRAFSGCESLGELTIPNSVHTLGKYAFDSCKSLGNINLSNNLKKIECGTFEYCTSLTHITIPNTVTYIGDYAFYGSSLKTVTMPSGINCDEDTFPSGVEFTYTTPASSTAQTAFDNSEVDTLSADSTNAVVLGETSNVSEIKTQSESIQPESRYAYFKNLHPKEIYNFYVIKSFSTDDLMSADNLLYISQVETDEDGKLSILYAPLSDYDDAQVFVIPMNQTDISDAEITIDEIQLDNGKTSLVPQVKLGEKTLTEGLDYEVYGETLVNDVSEYALTINGIGLYCGTVEKQGKGHTFSDWTITKQPTCTEDGEETRICSDCGNIETKVIPANGHTIVIDKAIAATCTSTGKTEGSHCSVCGTVIEAQQIIPLSSHKSSNWIVDKPAAIGVKGSKHKECTVCGKVLETAEIPALSKQNISRATVTLSKSTYVYDGKAKKPSVTVKLGGKTLKNGTDYTVSYISNVKAGTATVKITGNGDYIGSVTKNFNIKNDFKQATVTGISTKTYNGKSQTQKITVKFGGKTLKNGTDYTVSYSNNKKIGTASMKIVGKGDYSGTIDKTFKINPIKLSISKLAAKSKGFKASWAKNDQATGYEIKYGTNSKFKSAKKVAITKKTTTAKTITKLKASKKYFVRMRIYTTVNGKKYYGAWSAVKTVTTKK